ncbi:MAG TPA: hypothetical protein VKE26_01925 [Xanthobacteraceae bacterium]|nr:hypothetical protein [Xanthobacteraceae bacterium]
MWAMLVVVPAGAAAAELQIVNQSGTAIHELYLASAGERSWGADRLRQKQPNVIAGGETYTVADLAPGSYQLMLVDADGSECQIDFLDITGSYRIDLTALRLRECTSSH